jgi:hypothetical protein
MIHMIHRPETKEVGTTGCVRLASNRRGVSLPAPIVALFELIASPTMYHLTRSLSTTLSFSRLLF